MEKELSTNIIKWYDFKDDSQIVYIGENEAIVNELGKKNAVEFIKNIEELTEAKTYDYIIVDTPKIEKENIQKLQQNLNEEGKIIFLLDNKYGISNFITYNYEEQISSLDEQKKYANIKEICDNLKENNFFINKYMVYPNKNKVDIIINENYEDISNKIDKYFCDYDKNKIISCDEINLIRNIEDYDIELFKKLANSYFIEASKNKIEDEIKYVSFNNYRKDKYRLITKIKKDVVIKQAENEEAEEHIKNIGTSIQNLEKYNFKILDKYENNTLYSILTEGQTLDIELANNSENIEYIIETISKIRQELLKNSVKYNEIEPQEIYENVDENLLHELNFSEYAFYDMVPKNCFYKDGEFYFFDQEWMEKYLPVEFIIYRSIINSYDLVRKTNVDELLEKLGILKYKEIFENIDSKLREKVIDIDRLNLCQKEYKQMYEIIYNNKVLIQENKNYQEEINNCKTTIENYKENNVKQDEYIKALENQIETLKQEIESLNPKRGFWSKLK